MVVLDVDHRRAVHRAGAVVSAEVVRAASRSAPVALVTSAIRASGVDTVGTDDVRGAGLAVEHLVALGRQRIAHRRAAAARTGRREPRQDANSDRSTALAMAS